LVHCLWGSPLPAGSSTGLGVDRAVTIWGRGKSAIERFVVLCSSFFSAGGLDPCAASSFSFVVFISPSFSLLFLVPGLFYLPGDDSPCFPRSALSVPCSFFLLGDGKKYQSLVSWPMTRDPVVLSSRPPHLFMTECRTRFCSGFHLGRNEFLVTLQWHFFLFWTMKQFLGGNSR